MKRMILETVVVIAIAIMLPIVMGYVLALIQRLSLVINPWIGFAAPIVAAIVLIFYLLKNK